MWHQKTLLNFWYYRTGSVRFKNIPNICTWDGVGTDRKLHANGDCYYLGLKTKNKRQRRNKRTKLVHGQTLLLDYY